MLYHFVLYCIILQYIKLYCAVFYYGISYYAILSYYISYHILLCYIILCYIILYHIILYHIILYYITVRVCVYISLFILSNCRSKVDPVKVFTVHLRHAIDTAKLSETLTMVRLSKQSLPNTCNLKS